MKKTELEKRWEEEEKELDKVECCESCDGSCECSESPEEEDLIDYVLSPIEDDKVPLVLITCNNRIFLGGLIDIASGGVVLGHPMVYLEIPDQKTVGKLQVGVQKIFHAMPIPNNMWFKHDALNMLHLEDRTLKLSAMYENTVKEILASESGIAVPTMQDIQNLRNG